MSDVKRDRRIFRDILWTGFWGRKDSAKKLEAIALLVVFPRSGPAARTYIMYKYAAKTSEHLMSLTAASNHLFLFLLDILLPSVFATESDWEFPSLASTAELHRALSTSDGVNSCPSALNSWKCLCCLKSKGETHNIVDDDDWTSALRFTSKTLWGSRKQSSTFLLANTLHHLASELSVYTLQTC